MSAYDPTAPPPEGIPADPLPDAKTEGDSADTESEDLAAEGEGVELDERRPTSS